MIPGAYWLTLFIGCAELTVRIASQLAWWQRKEYRFDRVRSAIQGAEGTVLLTPPLFIALGAAVFGWLAAWLSYSPLAMLAGYAGLIVLIYYDLAWIAKRGFRRPRWTIKSVVLTVVVLMCTVSLALLLLRSTDFISLSIVTVALLVPALVGFSVMIVNIPFRLRAQTLIARAARELKKHGHLRVVGITGSYGKTSTKFFMQQLLGNDPHVIATKDHRNSPLPIAYDIFEQVTPQTTTYLVEMGAYRPGEIRDLCILTAPQLGLITALGNQHVALFGSPAALAATKWELIDSLPPDGIAILNADVAELRRRGATIRQRIVWYSLHAKQDVSPDVFLIDVAVGARETRATLHIGGEVQSVRIPLLGQPLLGSAVAAVAGAFALGIGVHQLFDRIQGLTPFPRTMSYHLSSRGVEVIDDSYSANEEGVRLAIEHLRHFGSAKKIIVFTPLIELGRMGNLVHERIGEALARSAATVLLTNSTHQAAIVRGGRKVDPHFEPRCLPAPRQLAATLLSEASSGSVVLLEGRLPEIVRQKIIV